MVIKLSHMKDLGKGARYRAAPYVPIKLNKGLACAVHTKVNIKKKKKTLGMLHMAENN